MRSDLADMAEDGHNSKDRSRNRNRTLSLPIVMVCMLGPSESEAEKKKGYSIAPSVRRQQRLYFLAALTYQHQNNDDMYIPGT